MAPPSLSPRPSNRQSPLSLLFRFFFVSVFGLQNPSLSPRARRIAKPHQPLREYNHRVFRVFQTNRKADLKMGQSVKPISSPVPNEWFPTLAVFMLAIGLIVTASFFMVMLEK